MIQSWDDADRIRVRIGLAVIIGGIWWFIAGWWNQTEKGHQAVEAVPTLAQQDVCARNLAKSPSIVTDQDLNRRCGKVQIAPELLKK